MSTLRIGYVGCGFMAQRVHLPNIAQAQGCELVALAELRPELAARVAARFGIERIYPDHQALASDPDVGAVCLSLPYSIQGDVAADILAAGKDAFTEKPMALSTAQAERILEAQRRGGSRLMVGYMKRYDPGNELARQRIDQWRRTGEMGAVTYVRNHGFCGDWLATLDSPFEKTDEPAPQYYATDMLARNKPDWLPDEMLPQYTGYLQQYTHNVNLIRFFLDAGDRVQVKAVDFDPGSLAGVVVLDVDGVRAVLESGGVQYHGWEENTQVYFNKGWIKVESPPLMLRGSPASVEVYRGETRESRRLYPDWGWSYRREIDHFVHCLATGQPFRSPAEDAAVDVRIFEDIFRKLMENRREEAES